ncbi:MAG: hypothetical protein WC680_02615 [Sulfuricurvum sp.]|jgi:hypothetical protein
MKTALIIFSVLLVIGVIIYAWLNRDSDRVILTFATAMMIGALGFITKESISNKTEKYTKEIPIAVFYGLPKYSPLNINMPFTREMMICSQEIPEQDLPKNEHNSVDIGFGSKMYFDAIQYAIITTIFERYSRAWNVKAKKMITPNGEQLSWQSLNDAGTTYPIGEVMQKLPENYFVKAKLYETIHHGFGDQVILPPDTKISIEKNSDYEIAETFKNKYITLSIKLISQGSSIGIGEYSKILGIPSAMDRRNAPESDKYGNSVYLMQIDVEQNILLNGHPDMVNYRNWADSIVELLDNKFNYETIRENHLRQYQLYGVDAIKLY